MFDTEDRRFEPTVHRRQQARREGQVPRSRLATASLVLLGGIVLVGYGGSHLIDVWLQMARYQLSSQWRGDQGQLELQLVSSLVPFAWPLLSMMAILVLVAIAAGFCQTGPLWLPEKIGRGWQLFHLDRLKRVRFWESFLGAVMLVVLAAVTAWTLQGNGETILLLAHQSPAATILGLSRLAWQVAFHAAAILAVLGLVDYLRVRWQHERSLRMTAEELRQEQRLLQGNPQIGRRRKQPSHHADAGFSAYPYRSK